MSAAVARETWLHAVRMRREEGLSDAEALQELERATQKLAEERNLDSETYDARRAIRQHTAREERLRQESEQDYLSNSQCASSCGCAGLILLVFALAVALDDGGNFNPPRIVILALGAVMILYCAVKLYCVCGRRYYEMQPVSLEMLNALEEARRKDQRAFAALLAELRAENERFLDAPVHAVAVAEEVDTVMEKV